MAWYTAECLFRSELNGTDEGEQLCELRYFLFVAADDDASRANAWSLGRKHQHKYLNAEGVEVKWVLEKVLDVKPVLSDTLADGTEIYYKYFSRPYTKTA